MRTFGIWCCGLLASMIIGWLIASHFNSDLDRDVPQWGGIAGMLAFTCVRLWLGQAGKA